MKVFHLHSNIELLLPNAENLLEDSINDLHSNMELLLPVTCLLQRNYIKDLHSNMELLLLRTVTVEFNPCKVFTFQYGATATLKH